jgi:hypothetical protein
MSTCSHSHVDDVILSLSLLCAGAAAVHTGPVSSSTIVDSSDGRPRVCILGGGFGGLYTAIKLELLMWPRGKKPKASAASAEYHHHQGVNSLSHIS